MYMTLCSIFKHCVLFPRLFFVYNASFNCEAAICVLQKENILEQLPTPTSAFQFCLRHEHGGGVGHDG